MSGGGRRLATSTIAEVVLTPSLKSCLVNLPAPLVSVLANADAIAQNVAVEVAPLADRSKYDTKTTSTKPTVYFGWSGFQSQSRPTPVVGKDGIQSSRTRKEQAVGTIEVDAIAGRKLGLESGTKVEVNLHINPPEAHTVNIEPLTADDWDILNQHAEFLELNFLSQVRIIRNPAYGTADAQQPIILHLTATSTISVKVVSIDPQPGSSQHFVKVSAEAEVIVAPKSRSAQNQDSTAGNRSIASAGRRSTAGKSASTARHRSKDDEEKRKPVFLRPLDRSVCSTWIDDTNDKTHDVGLRVWVDSSVAFTTPLKGTQWVSVSIVRAPGLDEPQAPQAQTSEQDRPARSVVAQLLVWDDAPDSRHALLSSLLSCAFGAAGVVGGLVRLEPPPLQLPRTASIMKQLQSDSSKPAAKDVIVKSLKIQPFLQRTTGKTTSLTFGGHTKAENDRAVQKIVALFGRTDEENTLFNGPLTHKMILPADSAGDTDTRWPGGILRFEPVPQPAAGPGKSPAQWLLGGDRKLSIEVLPAVPRPSELTREVVGDESPPAPGVLVGVEGTLAQITSSLLHSSSIMLTGGLGSGKTSIASSIVQSLKTEYLFSTLYYPCRKLITDETRISTIKDTLQRLFARALWLARLGGRSVVVLDDVDKLCPVETELQVGNDNSRSRQISELLCSYVRRYCSRETGVVLLATAQAKESVNNVVIGGHVVRDIVSIKAPNKDGRRKILGEIISTKAPSPPTKALSPLVGQTSQNVDDHAWMDGSDSSAPSSVSGDTSLVQAEEISIDLLEIAGKTDGYYAGDIVLLVARARSESLIRAVSSSLSDDQPVALTEADFTAALKGFTPASLRNVTLQSSTTTFASIGGLSETRKVLLETLQYPTTYAPIFAKCPLRLRSGLLLYGYPGCGKTLLASAVAGECGLNFISVKGPEILNKYIGASEKSVRDLFERAQAARPCVLFFDEFDSIAPKRGHDSTGVTDRVVNQLLTQMDGAEGLSGVYVLAATSRPDLIDPALLRPGRLDKSLLCDMPSTEDRLDILRAVSKKLRLEPGLADSAGEQGLEEVARRTAGYSGADLQAVMYNAHLEAIHDVLGASGADGLEQELGKGKDDKAGQSNGGGGPSTARQKEFSFFRMGESQSNDAANAERESTAAYAAEKAQISAKLASIELARRRAKQQRHAAAPGGAAAAALGAHKVTNGDSRDKEPVIVWQHVLKSLDETRPSLSGQERRRLERVYREFVAGRSGDMKDGTQGTEVGGRTSLM